MFEISYSHLVAVHKPLACFRWREAHTPVASLAEHLISIRPTFGCVQLPLTLAGLLVLLPVTSLVFWAAVCYTIALAANLNSHWSRKRTFLMMQLGNTGRHTTQQSSVSAHSTLGCNRYTIEKGSGWATPSNSHHFYKDSSPPRELQLFVASFHPPHHLSHQVGSYSCTLSLIHI